MGELIKDLSGLLKACQSGAHLKYLLFWSHQTNQHGRVGKECLSQWYPATFRIDGTEYLTAEHFMMAEKARLFGDDEICEKVIRASHPGAAKSLGRQVRHFEENVWESARYEIVIRGNKAKFEQNTALNHFLVNTKNRILVEASPVDRIWGCGLAENDQRVYQPEQWRGLNLLGFALMEVRGRLREWA